MFETFDKANARYITTASAYAVVPSPPSDNGVPFSETCRFQVIPLDAVHCLAY